MKIFPILSAVTLAFTVMASRCLGQSLEDLEAGAAAVLMVNHSQLTAEQAERAVCYNHYMEGFFHGLILPHLMMEKKPGEVREAPPTPFGGDTVKIASSLLDFIQKRKPKSYDPKRPHMKPGFLVMAWYCAQRADEDPHQKIVSEGLLRTFF